MHHGGTDPPLEIIVIFIVDGIFVISPWFTLTNLLNVNPDANFEPGHHVKKLYIYRNSGRYYI